MIPLVPLSEFLYRRRVQFADTDLAGVVHFSWIARYMEEAEHALWRAAGLSIAGAEATFRYPRVALAIDFKAPLRFEDECEDVVRVVSMSRRSITYAHELTRAGTVVATGTMTVVCAESSGGGWLAVELPASIRASLAPMQDSASNGPPT